MPLLTGTGLRSRPAARFRRPLLRERSPMRSLIREPVPRRPSAEWAGFLYQAKYSAAFIDKKYLRAYLLLKNLRHPTPSEEFLRDYSLSNAIWTAVHDLAARRSEHLNQTKSSSSQPAKPPASPAAPRPAEFSQLALSLPLKPTAPPAQSDPARPMPEPKPPTPHEPAPPSDFEMLFDALR